jgi:hypothetical protein
MQEIDTSNGIMFPFYDPDTSIVYLCGKVNIDCNVGSCPYIPCTIHSCLHIMADLSCVKMVLFFAVEQCGVIVTTLVMKCNQSIFIFDCINLGQYE